MRNFYDHTTLSTILTSMKTIRARPPHSSSSAHHRLRLSWVIADAQLRMNPIQTTKSRANDTFLPMRSATFRSTGITLATARNGFSAACRRPAA